MMSYRQRPRRTRTALTIAVSTLALGAFALSACGEQTSAEEAETQSGANTVAALHNVLHLQPNGTTCTAYNAASGLLGDEGKDEVADMLVEYAQDQDADITAWSTDVIIAYLDQQCS